MKIRLRTGVVGQQWGQKPLKTVDSGGGTRVATGWVRVASALAAYMLGMAEIKIISTQEVADLLGIPKRTIEDWRTNGEGPPYRRIGKHVRYVLSEVEEWFLSV